MIDRRLTDAGAELVAAKGRKRGMFGKMLEAALSGPGDAVDVLREYLRYEALEQRLTMSVIRALMPASSTPAQLELPMVVGRAVAPARTTRIEQERGALQKRRTALYEALLRAAVTGSAAAEGLLREALRHETKQYKAAMRILLLMTPRAAGSVSRQVVELLDAKPDKVFPFSQIVAQLRARPGNAKMNDLYNSAKQACYDLSRSGSIHLVSRGLYQSSLAAKTVR